MIRLSRDQVTPPAGWQQTVSNALPDPPAYDREAKKFEALDLNCAQRRNGFPSFAPLVLKKQGGKPCFPALWGRAKKALAGMSHRKCAYCEGKINSPRAGQVDHFKPKSLFPSLAYDWDNYFLSCGGCNNAKHDKWPRTGEYLRPDRGDPSQHLRFETDGSVKALQAGSDADQTIDDFDLKRDWLVRLRKRHLQQMLSRLKHVMDLYQVNNAQGLQFALDEFKRVSGPANAYCAALTQCFLREWESACPGVPLPAPRRSFRAIP